MTTNAPTSSPSGQLSHQEFREHRRKIEAEYRERLKADPERIAKRQQEQRRWRRENPEKRTQYGKTKVEMWRERKPWHIAYKSAWRRGQNQDEPCDITSAWAEEQWLKGSALSGVPFSSEHGPYCATIDRIDSGKGYTRANCRMILLAENLFKNAWSDEVVFEIAEAILRHNGRLPKD